MVGKTFRRVVRGFLEDRHTDKSGVGISFNSSLHFRLHETIQKVYLGKLHGGLQARS